MEASVPKRAVTSRNKPKSDEYDEREDIPSVREPVMMKKISKQLHRVAGSDRAVDIGVEDFVPIG